MSLADKVYFLSLGRKERRSRVVGCGGGSEGGDRRVGTFARRSWGIPFIVLPLFVYNVSIEMVHIAILFLYIVLPIADKPIPNSCLRARISASLSALLRPTFPLHVLWIMSTAVK